MKPKNNRVVCPECGRMKMLFETEKKALNFIKWNGEDIDTHGGELRPYYCPACMGYHISSKPFKPKYEHTTDDLILRYQRDLETAKLRVITDLKQTTDPNMEFIKQGFYDFIEYDYKPEDKKQLREMVDKYVADRGYELNQHDLDDLRHTVYKHFNFA